MKPTTILSIILGIACACMLFCSTLAVMAATGQNRALKDTVRLQHERIVHLEARVIELKTLDGVVRVFDMILPESYRAELSQIDYRLRYGK